MSAISFDAVIELMRKLNTPYIKISSLALKRIVEFVDSDNVETTIAEMQRFKPTLIGYGRVHIKAADEKIKTAKWSEPYVWTMDLSNGLQGQSESGTMQRGFVSHNEANLMAELAAFKLQVKYDNDLRDLRDQLNGKNNDNIFSQLKEMLPFAPIFIKDQSTRDSMIAIAGAMGMMNNKTQPQGMAGGPGETTLHSQMTPQEEKEKLKLIHQKLGELISKVGIEKVEKLVVGISGKPEMVDAALTFL